MFINIYISDQFEGKRAYDWLAGLFLFSAG